MAGTGHEEFETLARRYWSAWADAVREATAGGTGAAGGGTPASGFPGMDAFGGGWMPGMGGFPGMGAGGIPGMPGAGTGAGADVPAARAWRDAIDWWAKSALGGPPAADDVVSRFNAQAGDWLSRMQQVAAQFAGRDAGAGEVADAWRGALGAAGRNPFPEMFHAMRGHGRGGADQWLEAAKPWLAALQQERNSWLGMPAFGVGRERQERLQKLAAAQLDYQAQSDAYNALMLKAGEDAIAIFDGKLAACSEPGRQLTSPRALFDLWIDAAEEAYAAIALSREFRKAFGRMVNAQMRLRAGVQREVELAAAELGMPTRTEVDAAHRKITELERALRRMRDVIGGRQATGSPSPGSTRAAGRRVTGNEASGLGTPPRVARGTRAASEEQDAPRAASRRKAAAKTTGRKASASGASAKRRAATTTSAATDLAGRPERAAKPAKKAPASRQQPKPKAKRPAAPARRPARSASAAPATRRARTSPFDTAVPLAPRPLADAAAPVKRKR